MASTTTSCELHARTSASSTALSSAVNLLNNIIGAGLFSMPWCLAQATLVSGSVIFVIVTLLNVYSFMLLASCCSMTGCYSYLDIGQQALGPRFGALVQTTAILYACGSLISYVVLAGAQLMVCIVACVAASRHRIAACVCMCCRLYVLQTDLQSVSTGDFLLGEDTGILPLIGKGVPFLAHGGLLAHVAIGFAFSALGFFPLSTLRNLDSLKLTSWLALVATLYAGFVTLFELAASPPGALTPEEAAIGRDALRSSVVVAGAPLGIFSALPIVNVAFTAHYNAPRYFQELESRTIGRYVMVTGGALVGALAVYLSVGVSGYLSFGNETKGDVLENFADGYTLAVGARGALLIVLISCYPKVQHSVRDGLLRMIGGRSTDDASPRQLTLVAAAVVGATTLIGTLVDHVEVVLAYKGAIFGSLLVYVWPAVMHSALVEQRTDHGLLSAEGLLPDSLSAVQTDFPARASKPPTPRKVLMAMMTTRRHLGPLLLLVWGVVTGTLGVAETVRKQFFA